MRPQAHSPGWKDGRKEGRKEGRKVELSTWIIFAVDEEKRGGGA